MSAYEELLKRCAEAMWTDSQYNGVAAVLAEVLRTLETVTPEMVQAWNDDEESTAHSDWLSMLHASPLEPPK